MCLIFIKVKVKKKFVARQRASAVRNLYTKVNASNVNIEYDQKSSTIFSAYLSTQGTGYYWCATFSVDTCHLYGFL